MKAALGLFLSCRPHPPPASFRTDVTSTVFISQGCDFWPRPSRNYIISTRPVTRHALCQVTWPGQEYVGLSHSLDHLRCCKAPNSTKECQAKFNPRWMLCLTGYREVERCQSLVGTSSNAGESQPCGLERRFAGWVKWSLYCRRYIFTTIDKPIRI